jgi:peptidyl-prolyl cis-trans isomerase C
MDATIGRCWRAGACALLVVAAGAADAWGQAGQAAAIVNGTAISLEEVEAEMRLAPAEAGLSQPNRRVRQIEALGGLIDALLLRQLLDREVGPVAPASLAAHMAELKAGLEKQMKSLDALRQETGQTLEQLQASIADQVRWSAYAAGKLTEERLQAYYRENKAFFDRTRVRASHIVLRVPTCASPEERARARARLEELRKHLLSDPTADFAELARRHSQDAHAARGGDVGFFPRKWAFDEPFAKAAFALPVGGLSEVVQTDYGCHLIKVTARDEGTPSTYEASREAVKAFCAEELRQEVLAQERARATREGKIQIKLP